MEPPLLAALIRSELIARAQRLRIVVGELAGVPRGEAAGDDGDTSGALAQAITCAGDLVDELERLAAVAATYADTGNAQGDRVMVHELLQQIVAASSTGPSMRFKLRDPAADVAPVYGHAVLLRKLLAHLLREMDAGAWPDRRIVVATRQLGNHLLVGGHCEAPPANERHRIAHASLPVDEMTLQVCEQIAQLHGGTLRVETGDGRKPSALARFTLSLPTSAAAGASNPHCADCVMTMQIELYASDLAELNDRCQRMESERNADGQAAHRR